MVCLQLHCCKGLGSDSLQPLDHEVLLSRRSNTGRRVKLLSQQLCNNTNSLGTVVAPLPCLNVRRGDGDATACVLWHSYGLMRCKDETVSTLVCMCNCISLYVCKTEHSLSVSKRVAEEVWTNFPDGWAMVHATLPGHFRNTVRLSNYHGRQRNQDPSNSTSLNHTFGDHGRFF